MAALIWVGLAVAAWRVPPGIPAIWKLRSRRDSQWPIGVQEENDERPWHRRQGTAEWRSRVPAVAYLGTGPVAPRVPRVLLAASADPTAAAAAPARDAQIGDLVDLDDAGRRAPKWALEASPPALERVHRRRPGRG